MQTYHNGKVIPTLLTVTDKKMHARLRKPLANIFAMSSLTLFEPLVDCTICDLIKILRRDFADGSGPQRNCDIDHWLSYCEWREYIIFADAKADRLPKSPSTS